MKDEAEKAYDKGQQDGYSKGWAAGNEEADALDAEIVKLREQLLEYQSRLKVTETERDAALRGIEQIKAVEFPRKVEAVSRDNYVRGLERAREIADEIELMTVDYGIETAIAAEIDKAKAGL